MLFHNVLSMQSKKVVYKSYPTPRQSSRVQSSHPGHEEEEEEEEERAPPPKPSVTVSNRTTPTILPQLSLFAV